MSKLDTADSLPDTSPNYEAFAGVRICSPGNVKVWRTSASTAQLTWDEPYASCNLCPDAIGYEVFGEGFITQAVVRPPFEITSLDPNREYLLYVTAKAAGNNVSTPSPFTLSKEDPGKPGRLVLSESTNASLSVFWTPSYNGEELHYRVYLNGYLVKLVKEPRVTLTPLQTHTEFRIEVRGVSPAGVSQPSIANFKTRVRAPGNLRFSQSNGKCRLAWDPVFLKFPVHEVTVNGQVFLTAPGRWGFNFKLSDVSPGPVPHHLRFSVMARLDGDVSDVMYLEATVLDDVPPDRPDAPIVSDITDTSAIVSWNPPSDDTGVIGYRVVRQGFLIYETPYTYGLFTNLTSGAYHCVWVRARDGAGNLSPRSAVIWFKTTGQAPSPPPLPPEVGITVRDSTSVLLSIDYPPEATGARILVNDEHYMDVFVFRSAVVNDLTPNVEYTLSVSSIDIYGQLSEPVILLHEPKDITPPSMPGNLRQAAADIHSVTLSWEPSIDDIGIHEYVIYNNHVYFDRTPLTNYTAVDLPPDIHSFEVCAMDLSGNVSAPATITVVIHGQLTPS